MYKTLLKLKDRISRSDWLKMVKQAMKKGKLTEEEYKILIENAEE